MRIDYNAPSAQEYINLRIKTGMGTKDPQRAKTALENSLFTVSIYEEDNLIGFGRVVGDDGITYVVSDIMVDPRYQRQGYGVRIMQEIDHYLSEHTYEDSYVCLIANSPADKLYHKFKFEYLPDNKCGMLRNQRL
jgi:GNAT superfamily N-acetyltransferase